MFSTNKTLLRMASL